MRAHLALTLLSALSLATLGCSGDETTNPDPKPPTFDYPLDDQLRLNHLQAKGSHNSYHIQPDSDLLAWCYTHAPLADQLAKEGVRAVELDVRLNDAEGYFEVFHLALIDERTTCRRFTDCLSAIKDWSDAFPAHHPILIQLEVKDTFSLLVDPNAYWQSLEGEIFSVFPRDRVITPDDVKGSTPSLREAIQNTGWPTLGEVRGEVLFFLDQATDFRTHYTHGDKDLDGRAMFVDASFDTPRPYDAVYILNDPGPSAQSIKDAVAAGFLVRTRADSDSEEAAAHDTTRRDLALASGAHIISTDYPAPVAGVDYHVDIPEGTPSRCNPLSAPSACSNQAIEDPKYFVKP